MQISKIKMTNQKSKNRGVTLVELLVSIAIFAIVVTPLIVVLIKNYKFVVKNKEKLIAEVIASEKLETIRNFEYDNIGTDTGWPTGPIEANPAPETREGIEFQTVVDIRYVDDPFDGDAHGSVPEKPVDLYPYDYKRVEVSAYPIENLNSGVTLTTNISPPGPETPTNTGILEVEVINASGEPVDDATINVTNPSQGINITITTGIEGKVLIPGLPPDDEAYHIVVSKTGYNSAQTYPQNLENPNPSPRDRSVLLLELTSITLAIDLLSSMTINTVDINDVPITDPITFDIHGEKTIGQTNDDPPVPLYKYETTETTSGGSITLSNIEWDGYTIELNEASSGYTIIETIPEQPVPLNPGETLTVTIKLSPGA